MTTCRCCSHEMEEKPQPALVPGGMPDAHITCWQSFCPLRSFTFMASGYAALDLSTYCPDAQGEAIEQMQARIATITERMSLFGDCYENHV